MDHLCRTEYRHWIGACILWNELTGSLREYLDWRAAEGGL